MVVRIVHRADPLVADAVPRTPTPEVLVELPFTPTLPPVVEVATPYTPYPSVLAATPSSPCATPLVAVAVPTIAIEGAEAFSPYPLPLCVTPTIWFVVEPLKLVGPSLTTP